jgi:predicted nucleic acid-binding protein
VGTVAVDAGVIIGFLDSADAQHADAVALLAPWLAPEHQVFMPASVYSEILVRPLQLDRAQQIDDFIMDARIRVVSIDQSIARLAASLRAQHGSLRLPDALALASAQHHGVTLLTLDQRLQRIVGRITGSQS